MAAEALVWRRWVQQLCDTDMKAWCEQKGELEMVDMLARIQSHLVSDFNEEKSHQPINQSIKRLILLSLSSLE